MNRPAHPRSLVSTFPLVAALLGAACPSPSPSPVARPATPESDAVVVPRPTGGGEVARGSRSGEATLFLMADIRGILRPCGCTVELQKGGFDRLIPILAEERERHPASALLHAGPLFYEDAVPDAKKKAQRERQAVVAAELIARTGITAAGATAVDEVASGGQLGALAARGKVQVTAANLTLASGSAPARSVVHEVGGLRIGIFALASPDEIDRGAHGEGLAKVAVSDPEAAARSTVAELADRSDLIVLLSGLGLRETKRLVRKVDGIDFAVAGGMGEHPAFSPEAELVDETRVMQFHREGRYLGRLTVRLIAGSSELADVSAVSPGELALIDARVARLEAALAELTRTRKATDPEIRSMIHHLASVRQSRDRLAARKVVVPTDRSSFSFTLTPLDWDLPQDPEVAALMKAFDEELARINIANAGTLPEPAPGQAVFVGTDACFECHEETREFWRTNEHAHAWKTLVDLGKTFDAECVSCHVTGYGMAGGSLVGRTDGRENVQCEACHGPGSKHVEDSLPETILGKPTEAACIGCHNQHHSPRFQFAPFREHLLVPGHGKPLR